MLKEVIRKTEEFVELVKQVSDGAVFIEEVDSDSLRTNTSLEALEKKLVEDYLDIYIYAVRLYLIIFKEIRAELIEVLDVPFTPSNVVSKDVIQRKDLKDNLQILFELVMVLSIYKLNKVK